MMHRRHDHGHAIGFLFGILFIGLSLGLSSGFAGHSIVDDSEARGFTQQGSTSRIQSMLLRRIQRLYSRRSTENGNVSFSSVVDVPQSPYHNVSQNVFLNTGFLEFSSLKISAPIGRPTMEDWNAHNWNALEADMQYLLLNGVAAYPHSAHPGKEGSLIIAGHSSPPSFSVMGTPYEDVFASLPDAVIGDRIVITDHENMRHEYRVFRTDIVPATYTDILRQQSNKKELVLFTCYPVGTTKERFVVRAELIEG